MFLMRTLNLFSKHFRCNLPIDMEWFGPLSPGMQRRQTLTLDSITSVREAVEAWKLDKEQVGLIAINGVQSEWDDLVPLDCRISFFPPLSGG